MASVALDGVTKTYPGGIVALRDVNLHVEDQELVALVGPSGCGKSSLLRVIAGLEATDQGVVRMDGRPVDQLAPRQRDVAMVFQGESLYPHLSVSENLAFPLRMREVATEEIVRRVAQVADQLGITDLLMRKPATLSGGQRQRVALGRAFVRRPKVFLLDEPFSNLDAHLRRQLREELRHIRRQWTATTILVTHDQHEAMSLGDRVAVMSAGQIHQCDSPQQLLACPANQFVGSFIGDPPMSFVRGAIQTRDQQPADFSSPGLTFQLTNDQAEILGAHSSQHVELGIRPGSIRRWDDLSPDAELAGAKLAFFSARILNSNLVGDGWETRLQLREQGELMCRSARMLSESGPEGRFVFDPRAVFFFATGDESTATRGQNLMVSHESKVRGM